MFAEHTQNQRNHSDIAGAARSSEVIDYRGSPVHELIRDLPVRRLADLLRRCSVSLDGKRVLIVGCGFGTEIFYLNRYMDANFYCTDISDQNVLITKKSFPEVEAEVADTEALPFADDQFDYAIVCDSLHHMARPYLGLYEMLRVAKEGVCIVEPHDCLLTRVATRLGLMQEYEEAGNYVLKLSRHDLVRLVKGLRLRVRTASLFATDFGLFERLPMSFRRFFFPVFRAGTSVLNRIVSGQGNMFIGVIFKTNR